MNSPNFKENLNRHADWRQGLVVSLKEYQSWRQRYAMDDAESSNSLSTIIQALATDRVTLAFVAEFSRGKTELINALFFAETGVRLLPSTPGRTTMSPTELFYDESGGSYIRLLPIETRLEAAPLNVLKQDSSRWVQIDLDPSSPTQMQEAFKQLVAVKQASKAETIELGLYDERLVAELGMVDADFFEIPRWRHALISFPHVLLKEGLTILDTPGLNALGSEPELTLNLLPSAQAIIFVIAADTGVTKSDMEMWTHHISRATKMARQQGFAIAMNKIDTMWDDLSGEASYEKSIQSQVAVAAKTLGISKEFIFPVAAKQALIAKIKNDPDLLNRSQIAKIEQYLAHDIIQQRQKIMMGVVEKDIGFLINESVNLVNSNHANSTSRLHELKFLDFENKEMIGQLLDDIKIQQASYLERLAGFKTVHGAFLVEKNALLDALSPERVKSLVKANRYEMGKSLTTFGMKRAMRHLLADLRVLLENSIRRADASQQQIATIYKTFYIDPAFQPRIFTIEPYQAKLEKLFEEAEAFRRSMRLAFTEQSLVVKKLHDTVAHKAYEIFTLAYKDAEIWGGRVMSPILKQAKANKKQIEDRLVVIRSSNLSKEKLEENIARLEVEIERIANQREELNEIVTAIEGESAIFSVSSLLNDKTRAYIDLL